MPFPDSVPSSGASSSPAWLEELGWTGRYRLLEKIGAGGMGQVWRAEEMAVAGARWEDGAGQLPEEATAPRFPDAPLRPDDHRLAAAATSSRARQGVEPHAPDDLPPPEDHRLAAAATSGRARQGVEAQAPDDLPPPNDHRLAAAATAAAATPKSAPSPRIVALKVLDPSHAGDEHLLARLDIEAAALMKLRDAGRHEGIVPILDFGITDSTACLVMEFIPGLNLTRWCAAQRADLTERTRLVLQVARACGWFHALDIIHRDLKPANILVSAITHQPVIVDFSIAKMDESLPLTLTGEALGTAPYMAPEQFDRSLGPMTPATDVYALGATLYELLTHTLPHPGDSAAIMRRHLEETRPARPALLEKTIPRDLECVILKALAHRPAERYPDGTALAEDLDRFLAGRPVAARPVSRLTHLARQARRKPALTAALAACLAPGGIAWWNARRQTAQRERFNLETKITTAMQQETWDDASLSTAVSALTTLAQHDATLATTLRQRLHLDVIHDIETRLQQPHLRDDDFLWLDRTAEWLHARLPEQAAHLQSLITDRAGRWQTQAELRAPFADMQGLFPRSKVHAAHDLLHVMHVYPSSNPPGIVITDSVSVPMEIDATFVAAGDTFHHIALGFLHAKAEIEAMLYKTKHSSGPIRDNVSSTALDPESYILCFKQNGELRHAIHISDVRLLNQPFRLVLRVERERAEAALNGRWVVRLDSPFALGAARPYNFCRISWPEDIGLQHLSLRSRRTDVVSPLEEADLLASQGQWAAARRLYENLLGDPHFGSEADCKIAQCLWREGEHAAACAVWEKFISKPLSPWRDHCLLHLAMHTLLSREWEAATRYLHLLPQHLPPSTLGQLDSQLTRDLADLLRTTSLGIVEPRTDRPAITAITQAFQVLQTPPLALANRLSMPQHFAGQDEQARSLYAKGLTTKDSFLDHSESLVAAANCLDQWCRLNPSESDSKLTAALAHWQGSTHGRAIWHMEQARVAARAGDRHAAITSIQEARQLKPDEIDNRVHTSLWLLEGMLYRLQGTEDKARQAWNKAREIAATVTQPHPLHLFDSVLLHSLAQSWDRETAGDVLTTLASRHLPKDERPAAQAAIHQTFLTDPAWITTFNEVLQDERGRKFAEDYVLCRQPPRELVLEFYRLLFEHYFLVAAPARAWNSGVAEGASPWNTGAVAAGASAWQPQATPEHPARVRRIVDQLVTEMAMNPSGEIAHLHAYLRAWNDPAAAKTLFDSTYPYSAALIENLRWLLQKRHAP